MIRNLLKDVNGYYIYHLLEMFIFYVFKLCLGVVLKKYEYFEQLSDFQQMGCTFGHRKAEDLEKHEMRKLSDVTSLVTGFFPHRWY